MEWFSFGAGVLGALMVYAVFSSDKSDDEIEEIVEGEEETTEDFIIRHVTLSCQTCRKLKRHKEIKPNLFQCVKCKRHVDLRKVS